MKNKLKQTSEKTCYYGGGTCWFLDWSNARIGAKSTYYGLISKILVLVLAQTTKTSKNYYEVRLIYKEVWSDYYRFLESVFRWIWEIW